MMRLVKLCFLVAICYAQNQIPNPSLHTGLTEKIGNFSLELLYHASTMYSDKNLIMSPFTVWTTLAVVGEAAIGKTRTQINKAIRLSAYNKLITRERYKIILQWLSVNTNTIELAQMNALLVNTGNLPSEDFENIAKTNYGVDVMSVNFSNSDAAATLLNNRINDFTHGKIKKIVDNSNFENSVMVLSSALYFKGQWTIPFEAANTAQMPFYNENGDIIGDVNMMYNRHTYPFANIRTLQARVLLLDYGVQNRLSMMIMLPDFGVTLDAMFSNFKKYTLDKLFEELRISKEDYADDQVDCFLPRFSIESDLDLTNLLKEKMGIVNAFDSTKAEFPYLARTPIFVSKIMHKAIIDVNEAGTTAAGVTTAEFSNRMGIVKFIVNRPFVFMIVERVTNSIVFGGLMKEPVLV